MKYTQKQIKEWLNFEGVTDITHATMEEIQKIKNDEEWLNEVGYSQGKYGCNGCILQGHKTLKFYVITARTSALYCI